MNESPDFILHHYFYWVPNWYLFGFKYSEHIFLVICISIVFVFSMMLKGLCDKIKDYCIVLETRIDRIGEADRQYPKTKKLHEVLVNFNRFFYSIIVCLFIPVVGHAMIFWFLLKTNKSLFELQKETIGYTPSFIVDHHQITEDEE